MSRDSSGKGFMLGAMIGAFFGAIGGLLYAPKKGSETRRELKGKLDEYKNQAEVLFRDLKDKGVNLSQELQKIKPDEFKQSPEAPPEPKKKRFFKGI